MDESSIRRVLCEILGVGENASAEEIHKGYTEQVKKWHPDRVQHNAELASIAEKKLKEINQAYECLKNSSEFNRYAANLVKGRASASTGSNKSTASSAPGSASAAGFGSGSKSGSGSAAGSASAPGSNSKANSHQTNPNKSHSSSFTQEKSAQQSWNAKHTATAGKTEASKSPADVGELRKFGTKIVLWLVLIFLVLAFIDDKLTSKDRQEPGASPNQSGNAIRLNPPYNPASPLPVAPQPLQLRPGGNTVGPPPGDSVPASNPLNPNGN